MTAILLVALGVLLVTAAAAELHDGDWLRQHLAPGLEPYEEEAARYLQRRDDADAGDEASG